MERVITIRSESGHEHDVRISAPDGMPLRVLYDDLSAITNHVGKPGISGPDGPLDLDRSLSEAALRDGTVVTVGTAAARARTDQGALHLAVIEGPDAGLRTPLRKGRLVVGRDPSADVVLTDSDVSRHHVQFDVDDNSIVARDLGSTNGTQLLDQRSWSPLGTSTHTLQAGCEVRVGSTVLAILGLADPPAVLREDDNGLLQVNRPPLREVGLPAAPIEFPKPPDDRLKPSTQWIAAAAPAALGIALALVMRNVQFLMFAVFTPITIAGTWAADRWQWRRSSRRAWKAFEAAEAAARNAFREVCDLEIDARVRATPNPAQISAIAAGPTYRLWERRVGRPGFLTVRAGTADQCLASRAMRAGSVEPATTIPRLPLCVDLLAGALGVAGPREWSRGIARSLVGQIVALHSPGDCQLTFLLDEHSENQWRWTRWIPATVAAVDDPSRAELFEQVTSLLESRTKLMRHTGNAWQGAWLVLLVDMESSAVPPVVNRILEHGFAVGITAIVLTHDKLALPPACRSTIVPGDASGGSITAEIHGTDTPITGVGDRVSLAWADQLARFLAPLRDASAEDSTLPAEIALSQLPEAVGTKPEAIIEGWRDRQGLAAPIGLCPDGPFVLDLAEHGPHALIAGTTGAGKSELLRTLVASLASRYSPDRLSFVLVDYKGGAAFAECAELPHTLGVVTDLDNRLTARALTSLDAELKRRERAFAHLGVDDLDSYQRHPEHRTTPIGRLVIVVDEFATLVEELPDFVSGLVGIAQRGRSLGVHLVLATQRPTGVVSADIKANVSLRIALRVADSADSLDVIGAEDAARLPRSRPGRAILQTERGLVTFQTARVTSSARTSPDDGGATQPTITLLDAWHRDSGSFDKATDDKTDLHLLRDAIREATIRSVSVLPARTWLPELPDHLPMSALELDSPEGAVCVGRLDEPEHQRQPALSVDISSGTSIGFIGGARSGRSTALRSLALASARRFHPEQLHVHVIDCAGGSFEVLERLPHFGTLATLDDPARIARLLTRSSAAAQARSREAARARVLLLIDGWDAFCAMSDQFDSGTMIDQALALVRDGASHGITVAVAGGRSLLGFRTAAVMATKIVLPLTDRNDYGLAGIATPSIPARSCPGRGVIVGTGLEVQLAVADDEVAMVATHSEHYTSWSATDRAPLKLRALPPSTTIGAARRLPRIETAHNSPATASPPATRLVLGVGGDDLRALGITLPSTEGEGRFLIAGPARSGRSTALITLAGQLPAVHDVPEVGTTQDPGLVLVAAPVRSPVTVWARTRGIRTITPDTPAEACTTMLSATRYLVVDDAERFTDTPAGDALTHWIRSVPHDGLAIVAARSDDLHVSFRGVAVEARRSQCGILLRPVSSDGDLLGVRLPTSVNANSATAPAGRGLLITDSHRDEWPTGCPIQVATPDENP